jgi:hypothetical protein
LKAKPEPLISAIISGGQTGVDRAALDFALAQGIPCGGWCPKGRRSEDGTIPAKYPLKETSSAEYHVRTRKNILSSDGTLIIVKDNLMDRGTQLTQYLCKKLVKPCFVASGDSLDEKNEFFEWLINNQIRALNVAGCREGSQPGIYTRALEVLEFLFLSQAGNQ